jgi:AraC-like DNA-binding protein
VQVGEALQPVLSRLAALPTGIVCASADGRTVYANPRIEQMVGPVPPGVPGAQWAARFGLAQPDGSAYRHPQQIPLLAALEEGEGERTMLCRNGAGCSFLRAVTTPVEDSAGTRLGSVGIFFPRATSMVAAPVSARGADPSPAAPVGDAERTVLLLAALELSERALLLRTSLAEQAVELIQKRYWEPWSLTTVARELSISPRHLTTVVSAHTGRGLMQLLAETRVEQARLLLMNTGLSVQVVARRVGLPDMQRFGRAFRRCTGVSPSAYRRRAGGISDLDD